jgi:DNA-binding transcriptional regulator GbsR (MarR family)
MTENTHRDQEDQFIERFGLAFEASSYPRMAGRIFGYLLLADPPHQSMEEIYTRLRSSKSSASTGLKALIELHLVEPVRLPERRPTLYRVRLGGWTEVFRQRLLAVTAINQLVEQGLRLLDGQPEEQRQRLQEMKDMYDFVQRELPALFERWEQEQRTKKKG